MNSIFSLGITDSDQNHVNAYVVVITDTETMIVSGLISMSLCERDFI